MGVGQLGLRVATYDDVEFLTDVVIAATADQGRLPDDFDEADYREGFGEWTREQVDGVDGASLTSVVVLDGRRVGRHRAVRADDHLELAGLQLLPHAQGRGIGTRLVLDLVAEAVAAGVPVRLSVEKDNPRARALYERLGFVLVGETATDDLMECRPPS